MIEPRQFRGYTPTEAEIASPRLGTLAIAGNVLGVAYDPFIANTSLMAKYGRVREQGYNPFDDMGNYKDGFSQTLWQATNKEHMEELKFVIDKTARMRSDRDSGSFGQQFVGDLLDPINYFPLKLGIGLKPGKAFVQGGAQLAGIEAAREAATSWADPFKSWQESTMNIVGAGVLGGGLSEVGSAYSRYAKAKAYSDNEALFEAHFAALRRADRLNGLTEADRALPRNERPLGAISDEDLAKTVEAMQLKAKEIETRMVEFDTNPNLKMDLEESMDDVISYARGYKQEMGMRELDAMSGASGDVWNILPSAFTDSPLYKAVSTPMKRVLQSEYPNLVKEYMVRAYSDSGVALVLNSLGRATPNSVAQMAAVSNGKWVKAHTELAPIHAAATKGGSPSSTRLDIDLVDVTRTVMGEDTTYRKWLTGVNKRRISKATDLDENEVAAIKVINKYFADAKGNLESVGLISTKAGLKSRIGQLESSLEEYKSRRTVAQTRATGTAGQEMAIITRNMENLSQEIDNLKSRFESAPQTMKDDEVFFPRFWNQDSIRANRAGLSKILYKWYEENPSIQQYNKQTKKYETVELSPDPKYIQQRVDDTITRLLGEADPHSLENANIGTTSVLGRGRSKHFRTRQLDIPNELVMDFIHTDPLAVMKTYAARIEPRYHFQKEFGKSIDLVMDDIELEMLGQSFSTRKINKVRRDFLHMYDRVSGAIIRNPDALNRKVANFLREAASFSFMGSAGLAAVPDFGRIVMEYDMADVVKGVQELMNKNRVNMTVGEIQLAGEAIDILKGSAHMRLQEDLTNNIDANELLSSARNAFYILNGLAPLTGIAKQLSGIIDGHTIIDLSIRFDSITPDEKIWLAKYGIDETRAKKITKQPFQKLDSGLYTANTEAWTDLELVGNYRSALNSGVLNTIMAGTPADKPIITDGVVYIPMRVASQFGMKEDATFKGYSRIENGLMGLPFQFYSYTLANVNKTVGALAQGQVKNRALGITTMMGLAYMSLQIRTPDFIWDEMSYEDRFARSFDTSGVMALYSDLFYTGMHTSLALGGPNITGGFLSPKFNQEKSYADAIIGFAGAGPSWLQEVAGGVYQFANGEFGEGAMRVARRAPAAQLWLWKDEANQITRAWAN